MNVKKYTIELTGDEMFDLVYALESYIESNITTTHPPNRDDAYNDFTAELKLLEDFRSSFGYNLNIKGKSYDWAEDWLKDLIKAKRKEANKKDV